MADVEKKIEYEVERKGGAAPDMDKGADRFKAGAKEIGKKVRDPDRDLETNTACGEGERKTRLAFSLLYINYYKWIMLKNHC